MLIVSSQAFSQDCDLPEITETSGGGVYCEGEEVTLSITGDLGEDATGWSWFANGECDGDPINDDSETSITVTVTQTMTYSVRGTGGCSDDSEEVECVQIEVILDNLPPEVVCPDNIEVEAEEGECFAEVTFEEPTGSDNCSEEVTVENLTEFESGDQFAVGVTTMKYSITDEYGNESLCEFTITVLDTQEPEITCPEDILVDNDPGKCGAVVSYQDPVASDNCPDVSIEMTEGLASGEFFPVGETTVTYTATDASGNTSSCSFTVTVRDVEPPVITVKDVKESKWPPNHKHFELLIDEYIIKVEDNCTDLTADDVIIDDVSSDEPQNDTDCRSLAGIITQSLWESV